jgi:prophage DNA circulation protein
LKEIEGIHCRVIFLPLVVESSKLTATATTCQLCGAEFETMLSIFNQLTSVDSMSYPSLKNLRASVEKVSNELVSLSSTFNELFISETQDSPFHPFSSEVESQWDCLIQVYEALGKESNAATPMTSQIRARDVELRISNAIFCQEKNSASETKVLQLEKILSKRSQEVSMQTARVAELEKLLVEKDKILRNDAELTNFNTDVELEKLRDENHVVSCQFIRLQSCIIPFFVVHKIFFFYSVNGSAALGSN